MHLQARRRVFKGWEGILGNSEPYLCVDKEAETALVDDAWVRCCGDGTVAEEIVMVNAQGGLLLLREGPRTARTVQGSQVIDQPIGRAVGALGRA